MVEEAIHIIILIITTIVVIITITIITIIRTTMIINRNIQIINHLLEIMVIRMIQTKISHFRVKKLGGDYESETIYRI